METIYFRSLSGKIQSHGVLRNCDDSIPDFGWAWVSEWSLELVRKPTRDELDKALGYYWDHIERYGRTFGWEDVGEEEG